jgi:hypothetical protein
MPSRSQLRCAESSVGRRIPAAGKPRGSSDSRPGHRQPLQREPHLLSPVSSRDQPPSVVTVASPPGRRSVQGKRGSCLRLTRRGGQRHLAARHDKPCVPTWSAPTRREMDRLGVDPASRDQPGDDRVRVPHLARSELVATPYRRRNVGARSSTRCATSGSYARRCGLSTASSMSGMIPPRQQRTSYRKTRKRPAQRLPTAPSAMTPRSSPLQSRAGACSITKRPSGTRTSSAEW